MKQEPFVLVSVGYGGISAYPRSRHSYTTGYGEPEHPSWLGRMDEGCLVVDVRPAVDRDPAYSFASPLPSGEEGIDRFRFPDDSLVRGVVEAWGGAYPALGAAIEAHQSTAEARKQASVPGPFDYAGPSTYAAWWARRGARVGVVRGCRIVWETEA